MEIRGGFFNGTSFDLHSGLNALIGSKGGGKSLAIEFIRFALGQISGVADTREDCMSKVRMQLGRGGTVAIICQLQSGARYRIERTFDQPAPRASVTDLSDGSIYAGDIPSLFPILAYSQNEVIDISRDPSIQLGMIDRYLDLGAHLRGMHETRDKIVENAGGYLDCLAARDSMAHLDLEVATKETRLTEIARTLSDARFASNKRWKERAAWWANVAQGANRLPSSLREAVIAARKATLQDLRDEESQFEALNEYHEAATSAAYLLMQAIERAIQAYETALTQPAATYAKWLEDLDQWDKSFAEFLDTVGGEQESLSAEQSRLAGELVGLRANREALRDKAALHDERLRQRFRLLDQFDNQVAALRSDRIAVYTRLEAECGGKLQLQLKRAENRSDYLTELVDVCHGMRIDEKRLRLVVENMPPRELAETILSRDHHRLTDNGYLTEDAARKLVDGVQSQPDLLKRILAMSCTHPPEDVPVILFRKDDGTYHPLSELSVGQKCTALLLIALADGITPILIDQPEDALDVTTVYQDVVQRLRIGKERRQFVVTTHNANVAAPRAPTSITYCMAPPPMARYSAVDPLMSRMLFGSLLCTWRVGLSRTVCVAGSTTCSAPTPPVSKPQTSPNSLLLPRVFDQRRIRQQPRVHSPATQATLDG